MSFDDFGNYQSQHTDRLMQKTVGFTCGAFDLLHAGHILMLSEAKSQCEWLIVGLHTDPTIDRPSKNKPIQSVFERYVQLKAVKYVDDIIPYDTEADLLSLLSNYHIDVRIIGEDYRDKDYTGKDLPIPIYFNKRKHKFSSTELRGRLSTSNTGTFQTVSPKKVIWDDDQPF